jgi:8-oxo-dGTP pyrophosphatase MutT (NUDIX family)
MTTSLTPAEIRDRLHARKSSLSPSLKPSLTAANRELKLSQAAVLLPLFQNQHEWHLIFIKRTEHDQDDHSGQIALPGGSVEKNDPTLIATALREAEEEIGLKPADVNVLGSFHEIVTVTDYQITPIVGILPWPYPLQPSPSEVKRILTIPLAWLSDPENHKVKTWSPNREGYEPYPVVFFSPYDGELLWGATANIVLDFIDLLSSSP